MERKEMREVLVTYCDYCGKEITPPYSTIRYADGTKVDLCDDYSDGMPTCKDRYQLSQSINKNIAKETMKEKWFNFVVSDKSLWANGWTAKRLEKVKDAVLSDKHIMSDLLDRHDGGTLDAKAIQRLVTSGTRFLMRQSRKKPIGSMCCIT